MDPIARAIAELNDPVSYMRKFAVVRLGRSGDPRAIEPLRAVARADAEADVREEAQKALAKLGAAESPQPPGDPPPRDPAPLPRDPDPRPKDPAPPPPRDPPPRDPRPPPRDPAPPPPPRDPPPVDPPPPPPSGTEHRPAPEIGGIGKKVRLEAGRYSGSLVIKGIDHTVTGAGPEATIIEGDLEVRGIRNAVTDLMVEGAVTISGSNNVVERVMYRGDPKVSGLEHRY